MIQDEWKPDPSKWKPDPRFHERAYEVHTVKGDGSVTVTTYWRERRNLPTGGETTDF